MTDEEYLKVRLQKLEAREKFLTDALHDVTNEMVCYGSILRRLVELGKEDHTNCPVDGRCLKLDMGYCFVRLWEKLVENKKKRKRSS